MTDHSSQHDDDALERLVGRTVQEMTGVDRLEAASRARLLIRLRTTDPPAKQSPRAQVRRIAPWAAVAAAASLAGVLFVLSRDEAPAPQPTRRAAIGEPARPEAAPARPAAPVSRQTDTTVRASTASPARSSPARPRSVRPRAASPPPDDRLASFVRAIQQLPPEVWARQDAAGPPVVTELSAPHDTAIAPIAINELPAPAWPEAQPVTSGEPR
jgi:hypothetical protein